MTGMVVAPQVRCGDLAPPAGKPGADRDRRVVQGLLLLLSPLAFGAPAMASTVDCTGLQAAWLSPAPGQSPAAIH